MDSRTRTDTPRSAVVPIVLVVIGIVGVAFRGSWGAFRDAALACHFDRDSASLYPFAVDGLMVVAILAAVLLRHDRGARAYCLSIIGSYTGASLLVNFLHGLGMFAIDPATGARPVPPWPVVAVIALLVVGSIFLGSHLLVYVWRHTFPEAADGTASAGAYRAGTAAGDDGPGVPALPPPAYENAKNAYRKSLAPELKTLSQNDLVERYGIKRRQAGRVQSEVKAERESQGAIEAANVPAQYTVNGRAPASAGTEPG